MKILQRQDSCLLTLLHSEWPKLYGVLAILSAIGLKLLFLRILFKRKESVPSSRVPICNDSLMTLIDVSNGTHDIHA